MKDSVLYFHVSLIQEGKYYKEQNQIFLVIFEKIFLTIILILNMQQKNEDIFCCW